MRAGAAPHLLPQRVDTVGAPTPLFGFWMTDYLRSVHVGKPSSGRMQGMRPSNLIEKMPHAGMRLLSADMLHVAEFGWLGLILQCTCLEEGRKRAAYATRGTYSTYLWPLECEVAGIMDRLAGLCARGDVG